VATISNPITRQDRWYEAAPQRGYPQPFRRRGDREPGADAAAIGAGGVWPPSCGCSLELRSTGAHAGISELQFENW